ncbi:nodulation protein NfeD [Alkalihalobacillus berkeleyi]|uniref:Nodulation protein NfeD n=2 Tax=Pseudalkalibacillus berkeleyi TaxID=1069813 RepID=A0ABS9H1K7_9BACL|nr:nodulation protein NfeD [Pseudalkalibacillus berkeleyi]
MFKMMKVTFYMLLILVPILVVQINPSNAAEGKGVVYFAPVEDAVERGLEKFLERSIQEAEEQGADYLVLEINTPGGLVQAANNIAKIMRESEVPIIAYVTKHALSAGAYIALNADQIVMKPSTTMGAAAVIDSQGNTAGKKAESAWLADMRASAELHNRDPKYALAMADEDIVLEDLGVKKGELLTLDAAQAKKVGYAEAIVNSRNDLLSYLEIPDAEIRDVEVSFAETIARYVTHPVVVPILLSIGSIGLVLELYSPGFGIPGMLGLGSLLLFFFGHMIAGLAGWESLILFILGIGLIIAEVFVPGGILGVGGILAVLIGIVLAGGSLGNILLSILIAMVATIVVSIVFLKYFGYNGPLKKIILFDSTTSEKGYISSVTKSELIGLTGTTMTPLRPSGTAVIDDERYDVVTEGNYIGQNRPIKIVKTEGSRIVVREINEVEN